MTNKEHEAIKKRIIRDIKILIGQEKTYYKPVRAINILGSNYIEYESNGDRNKVVSIKEYLDKIKPYIKDIINSLPKSDTWKVQYAKQLTLFVLKMLMKRM